MLAHANRRIVLNLDIKNTIYPEGMDAVLRAGARNRQQLGISMIQTDALEELLRYQDKK